MDSAVINGVNKFFKTDFFLSEYPWLEEMKVVDIDNNLILIGYLSDSEIKEDELYSKGIDAYKFFKTIIVEYLRYFGIKPKDVMAFTLRNGNDESVYRSLNDIF